MTCMNEPQAPQQVTTLTVATANVLNLANPGRTFYANQDTYSQNEFERKLDWLGGRIAALNADVLAVQEVWDEAAIQGAVARSGLRYNTVAVPGAENDEKNNGAQNTPRVGIVTRLEVEKLESFSAFPASLRIQIPGVGEHAKFERPPLLATLRMKHGQVIHMLTAHMKSKRPKFLQNEKGDPQEDLGGRPVEVTACLLHRGIEAGDAGTHCDDNKADAEHRVSQNHSQRTLGHAGGEELRSQACTQHNLILAALNKKDGVGAAEAMRNHIRASLEITLDYLEAAENAVPRLAELKS